MCPAPQSPIGDVLDEEPARGSTTSTGRPALVIDADAGLLLDANREGWALWGLDPARAAPPIAIDCAMPALQRLREMARAQRRPRRRADIPGVLDGAWARPARLPCRAPGDTGRRLSRPCHGAACGAAGRRQARREGRDWTIVIRRPRLRLGAARTRRGPRRGARCLARARAAHAAQRRHRLRRDPEVGAFRPDRQPALQELRLRHLQQRAPCAGRRRQHAAG